MDICWWWLSVVPAVKVAINLPNVWYLRRISNRYRVLAIDNPEDYFALLRSKSRTIHLLQEANVYNGMRNVSLERGLVSYESAFALYPSIDFEVRSFMLAAMEQAIGVYQGRAIDAVNPIYWLRLIVFLPRRALSVIGVNQTSIASKVIQLIYWILLAVLATCFPRINPFLDHMWNAFGS